MLAGLALFVAHVVKGITGFGSSLVAIPFLTLLYGPAEAIVVGASCDLLAGLALTVQVRDRMHPRLILTMFLPALLGIQVGALLLAWLPLEALMVLMGLVVGGMGARFAWRPVQVGHGELTDFPEPPGPLRAQAIGIGFLSGVTAGSVGAAGPPVVIWMRRWFDDGFFRAQVIALMALSAVSMPTVLFLNGLVEPRALLRVPLLLPAIVAGVGIGSWLAPRLSKEAFGRVVGVVLCGVGGMLLLRAAMGAMG